MLLVFYKVESEKPKMPKRNSNPKKAITNF